MKLFNTPHDAKLSSGNNEEAFRSQGFSPDSAKVDLFTTPADFKDVSDITTGERRNVQNMAFGNDQV